MERLVILLAAISVAGTAHGQTVTPAPTAQGLGGPVIPGLCLLSRQEVLSTAKVAQAATARLRVLTEEAQKEIDTERKPVEADIQAFNAEQAKLSPEQRKTRQESLQARLRPVEEKTRLRGAEIEATRNKAIERISTELQPVVAQVYTQRKCGLLLDRTAVIGGNMVNDLTQAVAQALDAKISTITFNRETVPAAPAQP
ncbi:OmpH family outer membrane protein [Sphingomonas sp. QA11]|uniref:OmpH family outer membrane protein n=1 Tax=Sphingomonas sp. QA11 TaxID=2950605 RepID=UPI00234B512D|nr:OmpH family outer membrane protein [Sphingomonas sp. QA11]WCM28055.1 OmpH family outer membrane protein [Sphingomonas sp. QA11]